MSFLMWSSDYSVKVRSMDEQHRKLIDLINQLHDGIKGGRGAEVLRPALASLVDYTRTHFAAEERLMQSNGFPGLAQHKAQHAALTAQALEIQKKVNSGDGQIGMEVLTFLRQWLINHIMGSDKMYGTYLSSRGIAA